MQSIDPYHHRFYRAIGDPIEATGREIEVLDLGYGTGLALHALFEKTPRARVTAVDLSREMRRRMMGNRASRKHRITVRIQSFMDYEYPPAAFGYVLCAGAMHPFTPPQKLSP